MARRALSAAQEETSRAAANRAADKAYVKLVRKLIRQYGALDRIGHEDMGLLHRRIASRYHTVTRNLGNLIHDLTQDPAWPDEPRHPGRKANRTLPHMWSADARRRGACHPAIGRTALNREGLDQ